MRESHVVYTVVSPESQPHRVSLFPQAAACSLQKYPVRNCTHLDDAGYRRDEEGQDVPNFLLGNLKQIRGTQKKGLAERNHHGTKLIIPISWV